MKINWFPGHMTKAIRQMESSLKNVDFVIYVLDSRAPKSCMNPIFDKLFEKFPILYVLNKFDLCDTDRIKLFKNSLITEKSRVVEYNSLSNGLSKNTINEIKLLCKKKIDKFAQKGVSISLYGLVVGIPNAGKSTFINSISREKHAKTGNKPGVTRGQQSIKIDEYIALFDTPGVLYPKLSDENIAMHLAAIGSIKDDIVDKTDLVTELVFELFRHDKYKRCIADRYNFLLEDFDSIEKNCEDKNKIRVDQIEFLFTKICKYRGITIKNNDIDIDRVASIFLDDFRKSKFGKIILI